MKKWIGLLVGAAVLFRLAFFFLALDRVPLSSDEAWPSLMAMHILKGEFPVMYWGQAYMGTQESYLDAVLIWLFGPSTFIVRLYPFFLSLLFLLFSYQLAVRIRQRSAGLIVLALLAVPIPYLTMCSVMIPPDDYLACTALGSWSLVLLHDLLFRAEDPQRTRRFIMLGFLLGFTFYLHILVISYIGVAVLLLFLRDKLCWLKREFWAGILAFLVGAAPLLIYNIIHHGATFADVGRTTTLAHSWEMLKIAFQNTLHFLIGAKVMLYADSIHVRPLPGLLAGAVIVVSVVAVLWALLSRLPMFLRLVYLSLAKADGVLVLAALFGAALFAFCRSTRSEWKDVRYILPALSALPVLLAVGLDQIRGRSRIAFGLMLAVLLAGQAWGNLVLARAWMDPQLVARDLELPDSRPLHRFLADQGINRAYAHFWISYRITYESKETLLCAEPYNKRFSRRAHDVKFINDVRAATHIAYIDHATLRLMPGDFDDLLKKIGGRYRKQQVGDFWVYYEFVPPYGLAPLRELPRNGWTVTASSRPETAPRMLDGQVDTLWESGRPQAPGMNLQIDLGNTQSVGLISFDLGSNADDAPVAYRVELSADGRSWQTVQDAGDAGALLYWEGSHPRFNVHSGHFTAAFKPTAARYVRITLTDSHPRNWWSVAELRMYAAEDAR